MGRIPKPLIIVVIVLVLLGVTGCAMGLLGGRDRCNPVDPACDLRQKSEVNGDAITGSLLQLAPPAAKVQLGPLDADCFVGGQRDELAFIASCQVRIVATGDARRRLRLRAGPGTIMSVRFTQVRSGQLFDKAQTVPFSDSGGSHDAVEVVLGRDESALITLSCMTGCSATLD